MDDYVSPSESGDHAHTSTPGAAYLRDAVSSATSDVEYDENALQYFCKFTFGQFFTLTVLLVVTFCGTFYLGAKYGNQYLRLGDEPLPAIAAVNGAAASGVTMQIPEAVKQDKELKSLARQALAKMQTDRLEQQARTALDGGTMPADATMAAPAAPARSSVVRPNTLSIESQQARGANEDNENDAPETMVNGVPVGDVAGTDPARLPRANANATADAAAANALTNPEAGSVPGNVPQVSPELLAAAKKAGVDVDALKQQYMHNEKAAEKIASIKLPADGAKSKSGASSVSAETPSALQDAPNADAQAAVANAVATANAAAARDAATNAATNVATTNATVASRAAPANSAVATSRTASANSATAASANDAVTKLQGASGMPYSVQLGAFHSSSEAQQKVDEWKARGYPAYLLESKIPEKGTYYRVRLGAFATRNEASQYLTGLKSNESADGVVVQSE